MTASRESIYNALFVLISNSYAWVNTPSRRLQLFDKVPLVQMPAFFQFEGEPDKYQYTSATTLSSRKRYIHAWLIAYINAKAQTTIGATALNDIMDAIDAALTPSGVDYAGGKFTLGGLVDQCRITDVERVPGDIDGIGMLTVKVEMILP